MKKLMMIAVIVMATFMIMPSVSALTFNQVNDITQTEAANKEYTPVEREDTVGYKTTTFNIKDTNLVVLDENHGEEKPVDDAAWFGVGVKAPADAGDICWKRDYQNDNGSNCTKVIAPDGLSNDYTLWIPFIATEIKDAIAKDGPNAIITKKATIYWNGESNADDSQEIIVNLHAGSVQLVIDPTDSTGVATTAQFTEKEREEAVAEYEAAQKANENELDDVPNTGNTLPIALLGLVATVTGTGIYTLKTAYSRK